MEKRYKVPEGMLKAALDRLEMPDLPPFKIQVGKAVEAAIRWLSENPIRPTDKQAAQLWKVAMELDPDRNEDTDAASNLVLAWQRMVFLEPEPEIPEAVKDLLFKELKIAGVDVVEIRESLNNAIIEAYRRGQKSNIGRGE